MHMAVPVWQCDTLHLFRKTSIETTSDHRVGRKVRDKLYVGVGIDLPPPGTVVDIVGEDLLLGNNGGLSRGKSSGHLLDHFMCSEVSLMTMDHVN